MPSMVERLLDTADELLNRRGKSGAARRRAVSTAYYAVFHRLAKLCAESLVVGAPVGSPEYARVYRALQHGAGRQSFGEKTLEANAATKFIGDAFVRLQSERERADYSPPIKDLFALDECEELVAQARKACAAIDALEAGDRRLIVTSLLFRSRRP